MLIGNNETKYGFNPRLGIRFKHKAWQFMDIESIRNKFDYLEKSAKKSKDTDYIESEFALLVRFLRKWRYNLSQLKNQRLCHIRESPQGSMEMKYATCTETIDAVRYYASEKRLLEPYDDYKEICSEIGTKKWIKEFNSLIKHDFFISE